MSEKSIKFDDLSWSLKAIIVWGWISILLYGVPFIIGLFWGLATMAPID